MAIRVEGWKQIGTQTIGRSMYDRAGNRAVPASAKILVQIGMPKIEAIPIRKPDQKPQK